MNLNDIPGIGPKTIQLLSKLNILTIDDLLMSYPYRYNIYNIQELKCTQESILIKALVDSVPRVAFIKKNFNKMLFRVLVNNEFVNVVIYNRAFLIKNITIGKEIFLYGKYDSKKNIFTASDIKFNLLTGNIEPVYHLTKGITNQMFIKYIKSALASNHIEDNIPNNYSEKYKFISKFEAIKMIHFPQNSQEIKTAKIRLIYEELFEFSFKLSYLNKINQLCIGQSKYFAKENINKLISSLPYTLTVDQEKALEHILSDMKSEKRMNRLVLGDVGSGKTIVATIAIYANFLAGYQSAFMAPTEILAIQHNSNIKKLLEHLGLKIELITGSLSNSQKRQIYNRVATGDVDLLIGTHAILSDKVNFNKLGLVITDEQHRFGVNQRSILQNKSANPDILYLSATPIPRTYAMTIYGDLDISMIKSKPHNRKEIITEIVQESNIKKVLMQILTEIKQGHQIYIVSPLIEQNDETDLKSVILLKQKLNIAYQQKINIEIIHGQMSKQEKDNIMNDFKNNKIKILISTTVIEVGIDVSNATIMVIFNAERFGLATLHQLRGRVGRSEYQSYCYLISEKASERLKVLEKSNDGFEIAEADFHLRGQGDLFGTRQSGELQFKIANLQTDYEILVQAKNDANEYINSSSYLDNQHYKDLVEYNNITN